MMSRDRLARIIQYYNNGNFPEAALMIRNTSKLGIALLLMGEPRDRIRPKEPERFHAFILRVLENDRNAH